MSSRSLKSGNLIGKAPNKEDCRFESCPDYISRDRAVVARKAHNLEVEGSNPPPATNASS